MRNTLQFGSVISSHYGVFISGDGVYNAPAKAYEVVSVPGRNGDLIISGDKYDNIEVTYPAFIYSDFKQNLAEFRTALLTQNGYVRLTDTYHPDEFRFAYFSGGIEVSPFRNHAGEFEITVNCKPQRFMLGGEMAREFTTSGTITNPTSCVALPLIRVYGYGTVTIGSEVITIANTFAYVDIDSEIQDCYSGTNNANAQVSFSSGNFPKLKAGSTGVSFTGNVTKVVITPRWWRL